MSPRKLGIVFAICVAVLPAAEKVHATDTPGAGTSYWGEIPSRADSVEASFEERPDAAWATAVDIPYEIVRLPLRLVAAGTREAVVFLDEQRVIYRVGRWLKPRELPYGIVLAVSAGGLGGFGGGATAVHDAFLGPDNRFRLGFKLTSTGNSRVLFGTHFNVGHPNEVQLGAGYRIRPNARFFGVGPGAREEDESYFTQELSWVGATLQRHLHRSLSIELTTLFTAIGARAPRKETPSLAEMFEGEERPSGYGHRSDGVTFGLALQSDTTHRTGTPEHGALLRAGTTYFVATDGSGVEYWSTRGEAQLFVPLWFDTRALAIRTFYTRIDGARGTRGTEVPFQRLMTNDDPDLLRGYRDFRWRDRGMALATVEYRWPIWAKGGDGDFDLHMYLFTDIGQVFGEDEELGLRNLTESFGAGVRAASWGGFVGRVEIGFSEEETVVRLRGDQTFQFQKGGLYHGRNPVPSR